MAPAIPPAPGSAPPAPLVTVVRWPTEQGLLVLVVLAALAMWALFVLSIVGAFYAFFILLFLFAAHLLLVTYVRGSAVRLSEEQFPELHARVATLAARAGLTPVPEAYVMQQGGALNAFATRFLRSRMIVLYTDLLDACGNDAGARDMVIGHELGHHRAGHLDFQWLIAPGMLVPFLGAAYSRARELTCDRWGAALCGDEDGALRGLAILAAGGRLGPNVNLRAFAAQRASLDTGWMTLGTWLSTYPPLSFRVEALRPALAEALGRSRRGPARATALVAALVAIPVAIGAAFALTVLPKFRQALEAAGAPASGSASGALQEAVDTARAKQADETLDRVSRFLETEVREGRPLPADAAAFEARWGEAHGGNTAPWDPYTIESLGYEMRTEAGGVRSVTVSSAGPDETIGTADDRVRVVRDGAAGKPTREEGR